MPTLRSSLKLLQIKAPYNRSSVEKRETELYTSPSELIFTVFSPGNWGKKTDFTNQGRPRQSNTSKMFDPIELLIPIEPWPETKSSRISYIIVLLNLGTIPVPKGSWRIYAIQPKYQRSAHNACRPSIYLDWSRLHWKQPRVRSSPQLGKSDPSLSQGFPKCRLWIRKFF